MNKYWTISDGTLLESDKPIHCTFKGLELEPLNHASAKQLAAEVVSRQCSRFLLVKNDNGAATPSADFTLTGIPSICGSRHGPDTCILLPSLQKENGVSCDLGFFANGETWSLFEVVGKSGSRTGVTPSHGMVSAQQRLNDNLREVFV